MTKLRFLLALLLITCPTAVFAVCDPAIPDTDGDGVFDCEDGCPTDQDKTAPDFCGCGLLDVDFNGDGLVECVENCEFDPSKPDGGFCTCPLFRLISEQFGINFNLACGTGPVLNRSTVIAEPPGVVVFRDAAGVVAVRLVFQRFTGPLSTSIRSPANSIESSELQRLALRAKGTRLKVNYEAVIDPLNIAGDLIKKTAKRTELTLKKLAPGTYGVKYRAMGIKDDGTVAFRTKFSPSDTFEVPAF